MGGQGKIGAIGVKERIDGEGGGGLRKCEHWQYQWRRAADRSLGSCSDTSTGAVGGGNSVKVEPSE